MAWATMVLKFEKNISWLWIEKQRNYPDFQIACPLPNPWTSGASGWKAMLVKLWRVMYNDYSKIVLAQLHICAYLINFLCLMFLNTYWIYKKNFPKKQKFTFIIEFLPTGQWLGFLRAARSLHVFPVYCLCCFIWLKLQHTDWRAKHHQWEHLNL